MNTRRLYSTAVFLMGMLFTTSAYAQFEGQISMNLFSENDGQREVSTLNLFATADRIMVKGEEDINVMEGINSDGFLIRNDLKDFVIMTGGGQALQITKAEIEGMVEMLSSWSGEAADVNPAAPQTNYNFSDRTQTMLGLETAEMIIKDKDDPNKHLSVWLTPNIDINWGMLAEKWNNMPKEIDRELNGVSQDIIFQGKNFPLMIEAVNGEERTLLMKVTNVNRSSIAKAMVEVPSGTTLMSFKDYMFKMMMEQ